MPFLSNEERAFARTILQLAYCNPFLPERIEYERQALGSAFVEVEAIWSRRADLDVESPNVKEILGRTQQLADRLRDSLVQGERPGGEDLALYETLALFTLYHHFFPQFKATTMRALQGRARAAGKGARAAFFADFLRDYGHYMDCGGLRVYEAASDGAMAAGGGAMATGAVAAGAAPGVSAGGNDEAQEEPAPRKNKNLESSAAHLFACFFQVCRAFIHIFDNILGESMPAARLRAAAWQSIFTHDMRRYRRVLYDRMADVTCLICGPSGTGKELVARAIGLSRFIPFDPATHSFKEEFAASFYPLSISALAPTLVESELFGHRRGAFTGAIQDRAGWLEVCPPLGTVFLDEIGDIDGSIQVKLLRVLQTRGFQRLGETGERVFRGKIIAATNRDLVAEMRAGRFREDLYYRLCSDIIVTPSLYEQLCDSADVLPNLVRHVAGRLVGEDGREAEALAGEVLAWVNHNLGRDYRWPGNVRELEQCVRNVMVRNAYVPVAQKPQSVHEQLAGLMLAGALTADELLGQYCTIIYAQTRNYQETARRLGLDHRTVKGRIDPVLLEKLSQ